MQFDSVNPKHTYRFTLARRVIDIDPPADRALLAPTRNASRLKVTGWHSPTPAVNGKPINLLSHETSLTFAIVPRTQRFVLGAYFSDSELQDYLTKIGGKQIFFFDTCYSGNILSGTTTSTHPNVDKFANELRSAENGIVVFTSSTGNELSQEKDEWNNGAFTKALVEGLRGAAARPQVPVVMISDLQGYISPRVRDLTNGDQKPMMAMPKTVEDYPISRRLQ